MGIYFFDQFSLLHFAVGIVTQFWGISFPLWFLLHFVFEFVENTAFGVYFIDKHLTFWPGGKQYPDSLINSIGDHVFAMLGWFVAKWFRQTMN